IIATIVILLAMTLIAYLMHPRKLEDRRRVDPQKLENVGVFEPPKPGPISARRSLADFLDYRYLLNLLIGLIGMYWIIDNFIQRGWFGITINSVNFVFLITGILLHPSPASVLKAAAESASYVYNIVLQFPFYSGMYGIIKGSGLSTVIGNSFVKIATAKTFPLFVYIYSGIVNYFVPSGGSKWAVEAPYVAEAAKALGVGYPPVVIAYAWGDMMTDLLQPFWALPLLTAAGIEFKEILGFELVACLFYFVIVGTFFYFLPFF
ncbi:MAG TPA: TIGR00366 family protein, partial [Acidobacteriota bacterium]